MPEVYPLFRSFIQAGFECSCHRNSWGKRLNLLSATSHDRFAIRDYQSLKRLGISTVRTAVAWPVIEESAGIFDFSSVGQLFAAAKESEIEIILDVLHFGWPDHINVFSESFSKKFAAFSHQLARYLKRGGLECKMFAPVNEISYLSWAGGEKAALAPHTTGRGEEMKRNLIRAAIASSEVLLNEIANVRLISPEPVIYIAGNPAIPGDVEEAQAYTLAQFESWDMISGQLAPELGGRPEYLDIIGLNFYPRNEWTHNSGPLALDDPRFRPFRQILQDVWHRYGRPMFVAETGTEDGARADWFNYVCDEVRAARNKGVSVHGVCLYPILNHPGWDDDRHCHNGLFDYADESGHREVFQPLADAIVVQQAKFSREPKVRYDNQQQRPDLFFPSPLGVRVPTAAAPDEQVRTRS